MLHDVALVFKFGVLGLAPEGFLLLRLVLLLDRVEADPRHLDRIVVEGALGLASGLILLLDLVDEAADRDALNATLRVLILVLGVSVAWVVVASRHGGKLASHRGLIRDSSGHCCIVNVLIGIVW